MFARAGGLVLALSFSAGCTERPRAAPLAKEAVYQNAKLGFRMLAPEGWALTSRTEPPPGPLPKPIVLVSYILATGEKPAAFEVILADVPAEEDPGEFLVTRKIGPLKWKPGPAKDAVKVGGAEAVRYRLESADAVPTRREMYAIRRDGQVLFFVVTATIRDTDHRDQAVRCIESVVWTK